MLKLKVALLTLLPGVLIATIAGAQIQQFPRGEFPLTQYERGSVDIDEILTGGPPRDGIPAIDEPDFISVDNASQWLGGIEPVIALSLDGQTRAYPLQILMYHEIVNDQIADTPIVVTFCPLCNASIVFERTVGEGIDTRVLDFGTTGRLRNSDLVMYDRQTESWWQQFTGVGIIGAYTDVELVRLQSQIVSFDQFGTQFPEGKVLSRDTGFERPYGSNPYRGYDAIDNNPFLFDGDVDPRLPAMERVLSVKLGGNTQLIPLTPLADTPLLNLSIGGTPVAVLAASSAASALDANIIADSRIIPVAAAFGAELDGQRLTFVLEDGRVVDEQTRSYWNVFGRCIEGDLAGRQLTQLDQGVHFAFAWLAFDPDAEIVEVR